MDNLAAAISGTLVVFAILLCAPVFAQIPAVARVEVRRLRRRWFPSSLLMD